MVEIDPSTPKGSYVLLRAGTLKYPTAEAARASEDTSSEELFFYIHQVMEVAGDVVKVSPVPYKHTIARAHCYEGSYTGLRQVAAFGYVKKANLERVLTAPYAWGSPGDKLHMKPGVAVSLSGQGTWTAHGVLLDLRLPEPPKVGLSYMPEPEPFPHRNPGEIGTQAPTLPYLTYETSLRVAGQTLTVKSRPTKERGEIERRMEREVHLKTVQAQKSRRTPHGAEIMVRVAEPCVELEGVVPPGGVTDSDWGTVGGMASRRPRAKVKGRVAPAGARVQWPDGSLAGVLLAPYATSTTSGPICLNAAQDLAHEVCVPEAAVVRDCREACKQSGLCSVSSDHRCVAASEKDCAQSRACIDGGLCAASAGVCVASAVGCERSSKCRELGRCDAGGKVCVASTKKSCKRSLGCKRWGACVLRDGRCERKTPCARSPECKASGRCSADPETGKCVATSQEACQRSRACKTEGLCDLRDDGWCVATSDAMCRASARCKSAGDCARDGIRCAPADDEQCQQSALCRSDGMCERKKPQFGSSFHPKPYCGATTWACKKSLNCQKRGRCMAMIASPPGARSSGPRRWICVGPKKRTR